MSISSGRQVGKVPEVWMLCRNQSLRFPTAAQSRTRWSNTYLHSDRIFFFTALTAFYVLLVPTMGRAEINIDKVLWIAENGIGVGRYQQRTLQQQQPPLFFFCRIHIHPVFHIVSRTLYCLLLLVLLLLLPLPLFFSSYCARPPLIPPS